MHNKTKFIPAIQWHEGMMLSPQHFQQMESRHHQEITYHINRVSPHHWGVEHLKFDSILLPSGIVRVVELEAVMPDGLLVSHTPANPPLEVNVSSMKDDVIDDEIYIYLCVPEQVEGVSPVVGDWPRYISAEGDNTVDDNLPDNVIRIPRLYPKMCLIAERHPPARYISFPIARISFKDESYVLDHYSPPCFRISQVNKLNDLCAAMTRRLREKASYLSEKWQNQVGTPLITETAGQLAPLVESLPKLEPLLHAGTTHPYQLFLAVCQAAGNLSTLRLGQLPPIFPAYNHNNIHASFAPLIEWINLVLTSIEKTFSLIIFDKNGRRFSSLIQPELMEKEMLMGIKAAPSMSEGDLEHWMRECIIASDSKVESMRIRRITGAKRTVLQGHELFELMPGRNVMIFRVAVDPESIVPGEPLNVINFADQDGTRPLDVFLYVKNISKRERQSG